MGPPIVCDIDVGEMLRQRMSALEEGCASEDELELEGDGHQQEDGWEDEEEVRAPGPSKKPTKKLPERRRRRRESTSSEGTISDLSVLSEAPPSGKQPINHRKRYRKKRRLQDRLKNDAASGLKSVWVQRKEESIPINLPHIDASTLPANSTGFGGKPQPSFRSNYTLEELADRGFVYVAAAGKEARPLVDRAGRTIGVTNCIPHDEESWGKVVRGLERGVADGISALSFSKKQCLHKRGHFAALNVGVAYGGGRQVAGNIYLPSKARRFMRRLLRRRSFKRWSGFLNQIFKTYNPKMYAEYEDKMDLLYASDRSLRRNFFNSVFAALAINFSNRVDCDGHTDDGNRPDGWCGITPSGKFDHRRSGHLVLWELKLVLEFPRGSSTFIPSAVVTHSTLPIREGETRHSMTQYTGGGLFRWIYNGYRSDKVWLAEATEEQLAQREQDRVERWVKGLDLFPKLSVESIETM